MRLPNSRASLFSNRKRRDSAENPSAEKIYPTDCEITFGAPQGSIAGPSTFHNAFTAAVKRMSYAVRYCWFSDNKAPARSTEIETVYFATERITRILESTF